MSKDLTLILDKINKIDEKIEKLNTALSNHINFIDNSYKWIQPSLNFINDRVKNITEPLLLNDNLVNTTLMHFNYTNCLACIILFSFYHIMQNIYI